MHAFHPQLLSQDDIRAMVAEIPPEELRQAQKHSLTPPKTADSLQIGHAASRRNVVKIKPPLAVTEEQLDRAMDIVQRALEHVS